MGLYHAVRLSCRILNSNQLWHMSCQLLAILSDVAPLPALLSSPSGDTGYHFQSDAACCSVYSASCWISSSVSRGPKVHLPCRHKPHNPELPVIYAQVNAT